MAHTYKLLGKSANDDIIPDAILRTSDGVYIPKDEGNTDYQEYLEWAKTNTAESAD